MRTVRITSGSASLRAPGLLALFATSSLLGCVGAGPDAPASDGAEGEIVASAALAATAGAPAFNALTEVDGGLQLAWQGTAAGVDGFTIYRMLREEGFFRRRAGVVAAQGPTAAYTWIDTDVIAGKEYCYMVGAPRAGVSRVPTSESRCLVYSDSGSVIAPAPPVLALGSATHATITLRMTDNATSEASFVIERRPVVTGAIPAWEQVATLPAQSGSGGAVDVTDTGLDIEARYHYRARAIGGGAEGISNTMTASTTPWSLPVNPAGNAPVITRILHGVNGELNVEWDPRSSSSRSWDLHVARGVGADIGVVSVNDHRDVLPALQVASARDLPPGSAYCFVVEDLGTGKKSNRLCDYPYAPRQSAADRGPLPMEELTTAPLDGASNHEVTALFENPNTATIGALYEYWKEADGVRHTQDWDDDEAPGGQFFYYRRLEAGTRYCFRILNGNAFGTRSSNVACATTTTLLPPVPGTLSLRDEEGADFTLDLSGPVVNATKLLLEYRGSRNGDRHDGTREFAYEGIDQIEFSGQEGYRYCFRVRAASSVGESDTTNEVCAGTEAPEEVFSASISMLRQEVLSGPIPYAGSLGPIRGGARLVRINFPTQFPARALVKPGRDTQECNNPDAVVIVHGDMTPSQMRDVWGTSEIVLSGTERLHFVGCAAATSQVFNALPVNVDWVAP